ncbi:MAG: alanine racemase [Faecousia sp.]
MDYLKRTWADISLDNLNHNYHALREKLPASCRFLGVVKADAYGHGAVPISRYLTGLGAEYLAVSNIEEAVQLRRGGIRGPILILGYTPPKHAEDLAKMGLRQEIHSLEYARMLNEKLEGTSLRIRVHIKLDTGMSRLGFFAYNCERTVTELQEVAAMKHLLIEGIFTHFPVADSIDGADENFTRTQFDRFRQMLSALKGVGIEPQIRHCCNSGASVLYPEFALDMIRPGIATYGVLPSSDLRGRIDLKPVMQLRSTIFQIRDFEPNITVSYGRTYTTADPERIAVVGIGYADGLSRSFSNNISFLLHGKRVPQIGRICMDMCMVDISRVPEAQVGDTVTIFGTDGDDSIEVDSLSCRLNTIPYEILCGINKRIPRIYLDGENETEILQYIV